MCTEFYEQCINIRSKQDIIWKMNVILNGGTIRKQAVFRALKKLDIRSVKLKHILLHEK